MNMITKKKYQLTKLDKKILALFIAGFLVEGNLKKIFSQYDDIKLDYLFDFIDIKENAIIKLSNISYEEFFEENFKLDLMNITNFTRKKLLGEGINSITPEIIANSLEDASYNGSDILDFFARIYDLCENAFGFYSHPVFKALRNYNSIEKSQREKNAPQVSVTTNTELDEQRRTSIDFDDARVWLLLEKLQKKFIGQESIAESLFYNIVNNQQLAEMDELLDGQRSIIFLDGPTGTGKTAITREIIEKLGIPFTETSITNYSSTGYVGGDITDTLKDLYKKANGDLEIAQKGIIVFDEFDKIAYSRSGGLEMKRAIQQQLLDFLGGGKYTICVDNSIFNKKYIEFDTSKLTFVCLSALTDLRSQKEAKKQSIGFGKISQQIEQQDYSITPQDLIELD